MPQERRMLFATFSSVSPSRYWCAVYAAFAPAEIMSRSARERQFLFSPSDDTIIIIGNNHNPK